MIQMRRYSKLNSILEQFNHPDLDNILLVVEESKPTAFPKKQQVETLIFDSFLDECQRFLSQQYKFHQFSKKITSRSTDIINEIDKIQRYNKVAAKPEVESEIQRILSKTQLNSGREECLSKIIDHFQIPDQMVKKIVDPGSPVDAAFFQSVHQLEKQKLLLVTLQSFGDSRLVDSIRKNHSSLMNLAITKTIKNLNKLSQISDLQLLKQYKDILKETDENKKRFEEGIINSRKQVNKNYFAPIISQLNYSLKKPVQEYYFDIFSEILKKFSEEREFLQQLFPQTKSKLLTELMTSFVSDIYFRLQRCFFKAMEPLSLCKIKRQYLSYYSKLRQLLGTSQYKSVHLEASLAKLDQCIDSVIKTEAEKMTKNKYNIYSVAGYVSIAQILKTLHEAFILDDKNSRWVQPFYRLVQSRAPTQLNKSLVIFNINIWEIYIKVFGQQKQIQFEKENILQKALSSVQKGCEMFLTMNQKQFIEKVFQGCTELPSDQKKILQYVLNLCSSDPKKILHSQLTLIIHQNIRNKIKETVNSFLIRYYQHILSIVPPMTNEELKGKCLQAGINIKTLGRAADVVYVPTKQQMMSLIQ